MAKVSYLRARDASLSTGGHPPVAATTIPVTDGLIYAGLYSGGADYAETNWAGTDGSAAGAPVAPGRFVRFPDGSFVDTGLAESPAFTCLVIGKAPATFAPLVFMGNHGGSEATQGITMFAYDTIRIAGFIKTAAGTNGMTIAANVNQWGMYAMLSPANGNGKRLMNLTAGTESTGADTSPRQVSGARNMRIGASYSASASGASDLLAALYWNRALSQGELDDMRDWGRDYASSFGFAV